MSAPSLTNEQFHEQFRDVALARDAYFSGALQPAAKFPAAELAPPVRTVTGESDRKESDRKVTRQQILDQTLRLEMLLAQWRLESGCFDAFWNPPPRLPSPREAPRASAPAQVTDDDYVSQIALQLFGQQAA